MNAELVSVGSELLRFGKRDKNSEWLAFQLQQAGIEVTVRTAVDDDVERIASVVSSAFRRADVVVITGGLGPTEDDRTREALGRVLDESRVDRLRELYESYGRTLGAAEARQAGAHRGRPGSRIHWDQPRVCSWSVT